jgi:hypothetical protein
VLNTSKFWRLVIYSLANLALCETLPYSVKSAYCVCNITDLLICLVSWIHLQICNAVAIAKIMSATLILPVLKQDQIWKDQT